MSDTIYTFAMAANSTLRFLSYTLVGLFIISTCGQTLAASAEPSAAAPAKTWPAELLSNGEARFASNCGFCHGRDAMGGAGGVDLTRSELVADDTSGKQIETIVRNGRIDKGMPAFTDLSSADFSAIVAFIQNQRQIAANANGGRRSVLPEDIAIGNATAGKAFFQANCNSCHSNERSLAGIASRLEGLRLLMRMLYPSRNNAAILMVTTSDGQQFSGPLSYRDEFTVALTDANGAYHSWNTATVDFQVNDPAQGHVDLLPRYSDTQMHDVLAYLLTLH